MNKPRVLFDITMLEDSFSRRHARTGTYFVAYNLFRELLQREEIEITAYSNRRRLARKYLRQYFPEHVGIRIVSSSHSDGFAEHSAFFSTGNPIDDGLRQYNPTMSFYNILYDIIPVFHPEYFPYSQSPTMVHMLYEFNNNDFYFSISEATKKDVVRMGEGINPNRIQVIPLAANSNFYQCLDQNSLAHVREKYKIPDNAPYILSLCTREPRKNLIAAVTAFTEFIHKNNVEDLVFVLAGSQWKMFRDQLRNRVPHFDAYADRVLEIGYVDDEDLAPLYSGAQWFVYTSKYEGFGLPPLEAMQCGCPVVTSTSSSLPEVVGKAGLMVDCDSIPEHVQAYEKYYFSEEARRNYSVLGLERSKLFTWRECADIVSRQFCSDHQKKSILSSVSILCHADAVESAQHQDYNHVAIRSDNSGLHDAIIGFLNDSPSEYACIMGEGSRFLRDDHIAFSVAKANELNADLLFVDTQECAHSFPTVKKDGLLSLILGEGCAWNGFLVKKTLLEHQGEVFKEFRFVSTASLALWLVLKARTFTRLPITSVWSDVAKVPPRLDAILDFSDAEMTSLATGTIFRNAPLDAALQLIGRFPIAETRKRLYERLFRRRFFPTSFFDELREEVQSSRHLLFGFIPMDVQAEGNAVAYTMTLRVLSIPFATIRKRFGARSTLYLFGLVPLFRSRRR